MKKDTEKEEEDKYEGKKGRTSQVVLKNYPSDYKGLSVQTKNSFKNGGSSKPKYFRKYSTLVPKPRYNWLKGPNKSPFRPIFSPTSGSTEKGVVPQSQRNRRQKVATKKSQKYVQQIPAKYKSQMEKIIEEESDSSGDGSQRVKLAYEDTFLSDGQSVVDIHERKSEESDHTEIDENISSEHDSCDDLEDTTDPTPAISKHFNADSKASHHPGMHQRRFSFIKKTKGGLEEEKEMGKSHRATEGYKYFQEDLNHSMVGKHGKQHKGMPMNTLGVRFLDEKSSDMDKDKQTEMNKSKFGTRGYE